MANIASNIELYDRVSAPVNKIIGALNNMIGTFQSVDSAMNSGFDPSVIDSARRQVDLAAQEMNQLGEEIRRNEQKQEGFNNKVEECVGVASKLKTVLGLAGAYFGLSELKQQATQAIEFASDLAEVQNVVDVAFGNSSKVIDDWATTTLESYGLNELSAKQFAGTMGAMLKSSGVAGDEVAGMSMKIAELAGDMASFYNLEGEEAFTKLRSGISGETEPLKQLGINMSVANLEAYALSQGINKAYNEMSQGEQVMLRYNYLLQTTQDAQGDFARTSDSFANQQKLLTENWKAFTGELAGDVLPVLTAGIRALNAVVGFMADNWSILSPILAAVAASIALVNAPLLAQAGLWLWNTVLVPAYNAVVGFLSLGYGVLTGSTAAASAAQLMYNNALLASPLTWILLIIIAVIAAFYAVIAVINKVTNKSLSATGMIVGALMTAVAFIWNLFLGLVDLILACVNYIVNPWISFANFFANLFNDPIGAIIHSFGDMADRILGIIESIAKALDKVFGTDMAGAVAGWRSGLDSWIEGAANKHGNGSYEKVAEELNLSSESLGLGRWAYGDAYNTGHNWGANLESSMADAFNSGDAADYMAETAENTGKSADTLDIATEDLKYLKDLAEQEAVNRFTTAEIKVDMTNNNNINKGMDLDGVIEHLVVGVNNAMAKAAEGVYA